ncbi:MAG: GNAT family N-acetyltransferase, partial [Pseudoclavibacter sp.]
WLRRDHVARFWVHDTSDEAIERDFAGSFLGTEHSEDFIVEHGGVAVGFIQRSRIHDYPEGHRELIDLADPPPDALTIDYFIGEAGMVGRGLGGAMIAAFASRCWSDAPEASVIIVPVVQSNRASWGALRAAGFSLLTTGNMEPDNPADGMEHVVYALARPGEMPS